MKMLASEYYNLRTVRNVRGLIRRHVRLVSVRFYFSDRKKIRVRGTMILKDEDGCNILKVRRYKGRVKKCKKKEGV